MAALLHHRRPSPKTTTTPMRIYTSIIIIRIRLKRIDRGLGVNSTRGAHEINAPAVFVLDRDARSSLI